LLRLNLGWTLTTNSDVSALARACPKLQSLNVEGCKHLNDECTVSLANSTHTMLNLSHVSFFFVDRISTRGQCVRRTEINKAMRARPGVHVLTVHLCCFFCFVCVSAAIVRLLRASRCYWLSIKSYYGDVHDRSTLHQDEKDL
jgi:hypothetical protein